MDHSHYQLEDLLTDASFLNYCLGDNEQDVQLWETRIADYPEIGPVAAQAKELFSLMRTDMIARSRYTIELAGFKSLFAAHLKTGHAPETGKARRKIYAHPLFRYAAAVAMIILIAGGWLFTRHSGKHDAPVTQHMPVDSVSGKRTLELSDGTVVILNANSYVETLEGYNVNNRTVRLVGMGFFEVAKNEKLPFRVKCGNVVTTALGTSFRIRYYPHEDGVKVELVTGKVVVQRSSRQPACPDENIAYLVPGQELIVGRDYAAKAKQGTFKIDDALRWQQDLLIFKEVTFDETIARIEDWYGIKVVVENLPVVPKHFTGEFRNKSLISVLEALSFANGFDYSLQGDSVHIKFP